MRQRPADGSKAPSAGWGGAAEPGAEPAAAGGSAREAAVRGQRRPRGDGVVALHLVPTAALLQHRALQPHHVTLPPECARQGIPLRHRQPPDCGAASLSNDRKACQML